MCLSLHNKCIDDHKSRIFSQITDFDCAALLDEWNLCDVFQGDPQGTIHYNPPEVNKPIHTLLYSR